MLPGERAAQRGLERSLSSGKVREVTTSDFGRSTSQLRSSAVECLASDRNDARCSNEGGQHDELAEYLKQVKRW